MLNQNAQRRFLKGVRAAKQACTVEVHVLLRRTFSRHSKREPVGKAQTMHVPKYQQEDCVALQINCARN